MDDAYRVIHLLFSAKYKVLSAKFKTKTYMNKFEDIQSWQEGKKLYIMLWKEFNSIKDFTFKDQILRAALSITNNIAESFERSSHKEFSNFLNIARASCAEVRSMLHIAYEIGYIKEEQYNNTLELSITISKLINGFMRSLKANN
jgi:four helix bundle protein